MYDVSADWRNQTDQNLILLDEEFLATLSEQKDRQIYARTIALDINENPIDQIEGRVTGGSINVDGNSAVRRTCSLTLICDQVDINDFYWGIKTKFRLFIGLQNKLVGEYAYNEKGKYPEVVWFPQGTFVVAAFNTSISTNNTTITVSGKDKMCLLNGDLGGQLFASIDFGTEETKIVTMESAGILDDISSETLMAKQYYFEPSFDFSELEPEDAEEMEKKIETILASDETYAFVLDKDGTYYKDGNLYRRAEYVGETRVTLKGYSYYRIYKQVISPEELFQQYTSGQRFIKKEYGDGVTTDLYVIDKTNSGTYELKPLYTLGYEISIKHIPIEKIIRESVHAYAGEPYHNIIINDLDDYGLEQLSYRGDKVLLAFRNCATDDFVNIQFADKFAETTPQNWVWTSNDDNTDVGLKVNNTSFVFDELSKERTSTHGTIVQISKSQNNFQYIIKSEAEYNNLSDSDKNQCRTIAKIVYGVDLGYRLTDLTYPGDLISNIGDNLTSILDKIKTMLGDFEYFYDVDGRFIFQRKQTYVNTSWSQLTETDDETYVSYGNDKKKFSFNFEGNRLISAIQNAPVLNNLRNDFVVWGKRKGVSGADIPIHARYAIDKKPVYYKALSNEIYTTDIEYAYEQIPDFQPRTEININELVQQRLEQLASFQPQYTNELDALHLAKPVRKANGYGWEPGWWDIRDWAAYYKLVTNTQEDPNGTMKFYSSNDGDGCISIGKLIDDGVNLPSYYTNPLYQNHHVWLLEIRDEVLNFYHGMGQYRDDVTTLCTYYTSTLINGNLITTPTNHQERFHQPYSSCNNNHTYLYFLNEINQGRDQAVYFYNPAFPFGETEEELVISSITKDYDNDIKKYHIHIVDWREIIYQMALDFFAGQGCSDKNPIYTWTWGWDDDIKETKEMQASICCSDPDHFLYEVGSRNPYYYPTGRTGYEQYYTDLQGFWRQLYNPEYTPEPIYSKGKYKITPLKSETSQYYIKTKAWQNTELTDINIDYYFCGDDERINTQINNIKELNVFVDENENNSLSLTPIQLKYSNFKVSFDEFLSETDKGKRLYWNRAVFESPETLNFWFDFLDSDTELASFSVKSVGDRTKVINDDKAGAIFYKEIPGLILYDISETKQTENEDTVVDVSKLRRQITENSGYNFIYLPKGFSQYLTISYRGTSVKNKIDELLYQFSYCIENITLTSIPIYYLQPNTRIYVQDKTTGIEGEYIVSKITIPLAYNGTMSISASKAPERLY